jgi:hypothetical protein
MPRNEPIDAAAQGARDDALELGPGRHELDLAVEGRALVLVVEVLRDLGDAEAAQRDAHEADAVGEERQVHREALRAAVDVGADLAQQHADQAHGQPLSRLPVVTKLTHTKPTSISAQ